MNYAEYITNKIAAENKLKNGILLEAKLELAEFLKDLYLAGIVKSYTVDPDKPHIYFNVGLKKFGFSVDFVSKNTIVTLHSEHSIINDYPGVSSAILHTLDLIL